MAESPEYDFEAIREEVAKGMPSPAPLDLHRDIPFDLLPALELLSEAFGNASCVTGLSAVDTFRKIMGLEEQAVWMLSRVVSDQTIGAVEVVRIHKAFYRKEPLRFHLFPKKVLFQAWRDVVKFVAPNYPHLIQGDWERILNAIKPDTVSLAAVRELAELDAQVIRAITQECRDAGAKGGSHKIKVSNNASKPKRNQRRHRQRQQNNKLTARQLEASQAFGECNGNYVQAAKRIGLAVSTTREYVKAAYDKLGVPIPKGGRTESLPTDDRGQVSLRRAGNSYTKRGLVNSKKKPPEN